MKVGTLGGVLANSLYSDKANYNRTRLLSLFLPMSIGLFDSPVFGVADRVQDVGLVRETTQGKPPCLVRLSCTPS